MNTYTYEDLESVFEQEITDISAEIEILGCAYEAGPVLRQLDPVAFRCAMADWLDGQLTDGVYVELADGTYADGEPAND
jgi:hypothetical protein